MNSNPKECPKIYRDNLYIYLEWPTWIAKFEFTQGGMHKVLHHIPMMEGSKDEFRRPLKPDWATVKVKAKKPPGVKVALKTKAAREAAKLKPEQKRAADDVLKKFLEKAGKG